jgi:hypothetical protein
VEMRETTEGNGVHNEEKKLTGTNEDDEVV